MTIDFKTGELLAYNKGCVLITAVTLIALRDRWTGWARAGAYAVGAYVAGSYAVHMAKTAGSAHAPVQARRVLQRWRGGGPDHHDLDSRQRTEAPGWLRREIPYLWLATAA